MDLCFCQVNQKFILTDVVDDDWIQDSLSDDGGKYFDLMIK